MSKAKKEKFSDRTKAKAILEMGAKMVDAEFLRQTLKREDDLRQMVKTLIGLLEVADGHEGNTYPFKQALKDIK